MGTAEDAVQFALAQQGKPYKFATAGPNTYDCSGLVYAAFHAAGVKQTGYLGGRGGISRVTSTQVKDGSAVGISALRRGDIVFPDPGHVQIYLGSGKVVHAPHTGDHVRTANLGHVYAARRIIGDAGTPINDPGFPAVTNTGNPLTAAGDVLGSFAHAFQWISDKHNWLRIGYVVLGLGLLVSVMYEIVWKSGIVGEVTSGVVG